MKIKSFLLFLTLYGCIVFFILVNLSVFWVIMAGIVAFAYYVAFANYFKDLGKGELGGSGGKGG
jgi:hypothetical protein